MIVSGRSNDPNIVHVWNGSYYAVNIADFEPLALYENGGLNETVTEDWMLLLDITDALRIQGLRKEDCPFPVIDLSIPLYPGATVSSTRQYIDTIAWYNSKYDNESNVVSVPLLGDSEAQRIHWEMRNNKEQQDMKILLQWLGLWRLNDDGTLPDNERP